jgi:hypothetical protein
VQSGLLHRLLQPKLLYRRLLQSALLRQLFKLEKAAIEGEREAVEADLEPVRYLATPIGTTDEVVMRYFVLVVALLLDPAAVSLLLAAI